MFTLKDFTKIKADSDKSHLLHKDGHIVIARHDRLPEDIVHQVNAMPLKLAEGGETPTIQADDSGTVVNDALMKQRPDITQSLPGQVAEAQPGPMSDAVQAQQTAKSAPYNEIPGEAELQQGIAGQAAAQGELGKAEAQAFHTADSLQQQATAKAQRDLAEAHNEVRSVADDIKNGHINPSHYMENMNAGSKVSTAIGLILGGLGGGIAGQGNPALEYLNKQIDRDIASQRDDLGNKQNLLTALMHQYGNRAAAENMFHAIRREALADQIGEAAAKSKSAQAQAAAQTAVGTLKQQAIPYILRANALKAQGESSTSPESAIPYVVPEAHQKEAYKEAAQAANANKIRNEMLQHFDKAAEENTILGRAGRLGFAPPSIKAMNALALPLIHDQEGRVNEFEQKTLQDLMPAPGDAAATQAAKRQGLIQFMNQKSETPILNSFGIKTAPAIPKGIQSEVAANPLLQLAAQRKMRNSGR